MTTARALLRRLLSHGRLDPRVPGTDADPHPRAVEQQLEAARQRLKRTVPPPEEEAAAPEERGEKPPQA